MVTSGLRHKNCSHRLSLGDRKRRLNGIEQLESMYLFAPAGEVVFTPGVAFKFLTPGVSQNHISCPAPYDISCVGARP